MTKTPVVLHIPKAATTRDAEPATVGLPLPLGLCRAPEDIQVAVVDGPSVPLQRRVLDRWPDGSLRWVLLDFQCDTRASYEVQIGVERSAVIDRRTRAAMVGDAIAIDTDAMRLRLAPGSNVLCEAVVSEGPDVASRVKLKLTERDGGSAAVVFGEALVESDGPLRTTVRVDGHVGPAADPLLRVCARLHAFAGSAAVRLELTVLNDRPAVHPGNFWELGDPGSVLFRSLSLHLELGASGTLVHCRPGEEASLKSGSALQLYQDSSGGENWRSPNHVNRDGRIPLRFRGYELRFGTDVEKGDRSTPVVWITDGEGRVQGGATVHRFWQNFPKALGADVRELTLGVFPSEFDDLHELQGGEQKTHVIGLLFGEDRVGTHPLEWCANPLVVSMTPEWYAHCEAVPYLIPAAQDTNTGYLELVAAAVEGPDAFERKREVIDEYGWRNFGDLYADHESAYYEGPEPIISHYNNQYDGIWGLGCQFLRSGDLRWWSAMDELAWHVRDIDVYHTRSDKAAYRGGIFWHTDHYVDAGRSTHRSYPRSPGVSGGGPSNEHGYATGLMLHYFLTGDPASRDAALTVAEWILAMEDGRETVFRWLSRAQTGLASSTAATTYHGPGRGAGHAMAVLLSGFRLSGNRKYLDKVEALIRRCIHPQDDIAARDLLNAERRWSYTVFLQVLGRYLDEKVLLGEVDARYVYARASLLRYAAWMGEFEYPYLDKPEILEYPTETWAAQDMRKSDVFKFAARHLPAGAERTRALERSDYFFRASIETLQKLPTRVFTRPVVILLSCGFMQAAFAAGSVRPHPTGPDGVDFGEPERFVPQRAIALRRAKLVVAVTVPLVLALLALLTIG